MFPTYMVIPMPIPARTYRLLAMVALLVLSSAWSVSASAAVAWHADLAAARRASEVSRRPVLAIFTASWSSSSVNLDRTTFASDEAVALIAACFEPVCVDVDANAETTRRLGVSRVPTACILTANEQVLSTFELPETPAGFVASAARAAQEAAFASATRPQFQAKTTEPSPSLRQYADVSGSGSGALPTFGGDVGQAMRVNTGGEVRGTVPPGGHAIKAVAAKVRMLSDFASDNSAPVANTSDAIAASFRDSEPPLSTAPTAVRATPEPTASSTTLAAVPAAEATAALAAPSAVPAELPTAPVAAPAAPATLAASDHAATAPAAASFNEPLSSTVAQTPLSIEPSPTTPATIPSKSAPWLGATQGDQVAAPARPAPAAAVAVAPAAPAVPSAPASPAVSQPLAASKTPAAPQPPAETQPTTPKPPVTAGSATAVADSKPQKPATSFSSSLLSAMQKPFSMFSKPATAKPAPQDSITASSSAPQVPATAAPAVEPDAYGSMPVGLEGYCPVTLAERGVWVEGRAQWGARHRGRTYLFATAEQQKAFLADPDRYAPALSGDDPVLAFDTGKSTPGQRRYGVTYQSRTYLFSSTDTRDAFAANPQRYTSGALVAENRAPTAGQAIR
jgi:YHS domain-containing protein